MSSSPATTADAGPGAATKFNRYLMVTMIASPANLVIYSLLLARTVWHPNLANLAAATIVTVPTYFANRRWVWGLTSPHSLRRDVVPYWTATVVNVAASSLVVWLLQRAGAADAVLVLGTLAAYTGVWLARFFFLDRVLFVPVAARTA